MPETLIPPAESTASPLTLDRIEQMRANFQATPEYRRMQNAVTKTPLDDVALDRQVVTNIDHTFSHVLDGWEVTAQMKSGRCWMFAGLNLLRVGAMQKMNLEKFEFSQNYTFFWDKLERANYFYEQIIATADRPLDDRVVAYLLDHPLDDGGQWNMFVNLVKKYGLVPKSAMPETESSSNTPRMNANLKALLREGASELREAIEAGRDAESVQQRKAELVEVIYRVLSIHLGTPPSEFDWRWNDKDKQFHRVGTITPREFAKKYVTLDLDDYVCLVNDPRESSPFGRSFTVAHLGNVIDGQYSGGVRYVNVPMDVMKQATARSIVQRSEPVWMGCDVGKMMDRKSGLWDAKLFDYEGVYDARFFHEKAQRLAYHQTLMTHAMLFTGVDLDDAEDFSETRRWRVENSWGPDNGVKGFYTMNDSWFDQYMFEVAIHKDLLPGEIVEAQNDEPIVLPPWDPMGSLAR
jgi:bleomycin hydrolase